MNSRAQSIAANIVLAIMIMILLGIGAYGVYKNMQEPGVYEKPCLKDPGY